MTTPELAAATDYGRMYARVRGGEPLVPSITTVIGQHASDLSGWHGYMAAKAALEDQRAYRATGSHGLKFAIIRDAASASERYRDAAAARGDRVHNYAEAVALRAMGREHNLEESREQLIINGEQAYADRFDEWWDAFKPRPLAAEITIWNDTVGYAGTLDLVAEIAGRTCIIDYKTKGTDKRGRVKALDEKVVMQLVAGLKAEESIVDPDEGTWEPWKYGDAPVLMGVGSGINSGASLASGDLCLFGQHLSDISMEDLRPDDDRVVVVSSLLDTATRTVRTPETDPGLASAEVGIEATVHNGSATGSVVVRPGDGGAPISAPIGEGSALDQREPFGARLPVQQMQGALRHRDAVALTVPGATLLIVIPSGHPIYSTPAPPIRIYAVPGGFP